MKSNYDTIIHSMPWLQKGNTNNRKNINVVYPLFLKLSEMVDDPDWKSILLDSAKGKLPKGFSFNGTHLIFKNTNKIINLNDDGSSVKEFINFVRDCVGMRSKMDLEREKDSERDNYKEEDLPQEWSNIKSKFTKRMLIIDYVDKIRITHKLKEKEVNQLSTLLNLNMNDDIIKKNVILKEYEIVEIKSLLWDSSKRIFSLDGLNYKEFNVKCDNVFYYNKDLDLNIEKVSTLKEWNKFVKKYHKISKREIENDYPISPKETSSNFSIVESSS